MRTSATDAISQLLASRFNRIVCPGPRKGVEGTNTGFWRAVYGYSRLFAEEPFLHGLARELDDALDRSNRSTESQRQATIEALEPARALVLQATPRPAPDITSQDFIEYHLLLNEEDPVALLQTLAAAAKDLLAQTPPGLDRERWDPLWQSGREVVANFESEKKRAELLNLGDPLRVWETLRKFTNAPEWVREEALSQGNTFAYAVLGVVEVGQNYEVLRLLLPDEHDLYFELPLFHGWVMSRLVKEQARWTTLLHYKRGRELFKADWIRSVVDGRGKAGNADETELRDDLALYLHDRGYDVWTEARLGTARSDIVALASLSGVTLPLEVKVVRPDDDRNTVAQRLNDGVNKAFTYARRTGQSEGFLVVFWTGDPAYDLPPDAVRGSETVHVVVIDASPSPSSSRRADAIQIPEWAEATDHPAAGDSKPR